MVRSIIAIVAGFALILALSFGADAVMALAFPNAFGRNSHSYSLSILILTIVYVFAFAVIGSYVTAVIAGREPMKHALILGALGLVLSIETTIALWGAEPVWYHIIAILQVLPAAYLGGRIRESQLSRRQPH